MRQNSIINELSSKAASPLDKEKHREFMRRNAFLPKRSQNKGFIK